MENIIQKISNFYGAFDFHTDIYDDSGVSVSPDGEEYEDGGIMHLETLNGIQIPQLENSLINWSKELKLELTCVSTSLTSDLKQLKEVLNKSKAGFVVVGGEVKSHLKEILRSTHEEGIPEEFHGGTINTRDKQKSLMLCYDFVLAFLEDINNYLLNNRVGFLNPVDSNITASLPNKKRLIQGRGIALLQGFLTQLTSNGWIENGNFSEWQQQWFGEEESYVTGEIKLKWLNDSPTHFVKFLKALQNGKIASSDSFGESVKQTVLFKEREKNF